MPGDSELHHRTVKNFSGFDIPGHEPGAQARLFQAEHAVFTRQDQANRGGGAAQANFFIDAHCGYGGNDVVVRMRGWPAQRHDGPDGGGDNQGIGDS